MGSIFGRNSKNEKIQISNRRVDTMETLNTVRSEFSFQQKYIECSRCRKPLTDDNEIKQTCGQIKCKFTFHQQCFFKELNDQNTKKEVFNYKCQCGTKIPSKIIRKCGIPNLMELLSSIHRRQLEHLMTKSSLRKNHEMLDFYKENKQKNQEWDYILLKQDEILENQTPI